MLEKARKTLLEKVSQSFQPLQKEQCFQISMDAVHFCLLDFAARQDVDWSFYWSCREGDDEVLALGKLTSSILSTEHTDSLWPYYGAGAFEQSLPLMVRPRLELRKEWGKVYWSCYTTENEQNTVQLQEFLQNLNWEEAEEKRSFVQVQRGSCTPAYSQWQRQVETIRGKIALGELKKQVLARKKCIDLEQEENPFVFLKSLKEKTPKCFHFCLQEGEKAFFGSSPERLYYRKEGVLQSEAVAGTRPRGVTPVEDEGLSKELLQSEKDREEQQLVSDHIVRSFSTLCKEKVQQYGPYVLQKAFWQHLKTEIRAALKKDTCDVSIVQNLHPTPALACSPIKDARQRIRQLEGFERGYYGGPIGWVSKKEAEFAVAIRSAFLYRKQLTLLSGAGIVKDSNAEEEWKEIETKLSGFHSILS